MTKITNVRAEGDSRTVTKPDAKNYGATITKLEEAEQKLKENLENNSAYMSEYDRATCERLAATIEAIKTVYSEYNEGLLSQDIRMPGKTGSDGDPLKLQTLDPGWNGADNIKKKDGDADIATSADEDAKYLGTINLGTSPDPTDPQKIAYQLGPDDKKATLTTVGEDIVLIVEKKNGSKEAYVLKNAVKSDAQIVITAYGCTQDVEIDASKAYRTDGRGFYLHGGKGKDTIIDSIGNDYLIGNEDNDIIKAHFGRNNIWGDLYAEGSNATSSKDGDDEFFLSGKNNVYGGGGSNVAHKTGPDKDTRLYNVDSEEAETVDVDPSEIFKENADWKWGAIESDGTLTIENVTGKAGEIVFEIPPGFNVTKFEPYSDDSFLVTMANDEGDVVRVKVIDGRKEFDAVSPRDRVLHVHVKGNDENNIVDLSELDKDVLTNQTFTVDGGEGTDVVLKPYNALIKDGVDTDNILSSQGGASLQRFIDKGIFAPSPDKEEDYTDKSKLNGYQARADGKQIVITSDGTQRPADAVLKINAQDYEKCYKTQDAEGNIYIILVKPGTDGGNARTVVIKVDKALGLKMDNIIVQTKEKDGTDTVWTGMTGIEISSDKTHHKNTDVEKEIDREEI